MKKIFVKSADLALVNGGYVVTGKSQTPVFHEEFIKLQKHAEWIVTFAEKAKGVDFVGKLPASIEAVKYEVTKALAGSSVEYVPKPEKVERELSDKLVAEALAFVEYTGESTKVEKINKFMQTFNVIKEFEEFGLYFEEEICKLNKVYTIKEIVTAVKEVIDLLG